MTSSESTSRPRSQTARAKRSTSTVVFPVPAPAERLDPHQVAKNEHVERDLEPELGVDARSRVRRLSRLVVLDDPAGAERIHVDPVDLSGQREAVEIEAALELGRRPLRAERDLEFARDERRLRCRLGADEVLEVALESAHELAALEIGELLSDPAEGIVQPA